MANLSFQTGLSHCHLGVGPKRISLGAGSHRAGRQFQVIGSENVRARSTAVKEGEKGIGTENE